MTAAVEGVPYDVVTPICETITRLIRKGRARRTGTHLLCATSRARNHERFNG
jgi:hypothetical protein|tara:strand:+ start:1795 stop:1950 length:156 start_codon:yes stop_codon:yes gene_type:complete